MTILVFTDHGTYLGKDKDQFKVTYGMADKPTAFIPAIKVDGILVDCNITLSSGALQLIRKFGIPVIWHKKYRDDGMILQPFSSHGSVEVRKSQYKALDNHCGIIFAAKCVYASCTNKKTIIQRIHRYVFPTETGNDTIEMIETKLDEFTTSTEMYDHIDIGFRQYLMNTEAIISKQYYSVLDEVLNRYGFELSQRSRRPAKDPFNALLNYSYAVLEGQLTSTIAITGLDLYSGFLHTDRSGRVSLVLDMIEEFRQLVDELLLKLIIRGKITPDLFEIEEGSVNITSECREVLIPAFFKMIRSVYRDRSVQVLMIEQGRNLANFVRGIDSDYFPFLIKTGDRW